MEFSRHDLVRLTFDGLRSVSNDLEKAGLPPKLLNEMFFPDEPFKPVCGIVRREENPREGLAPVGYTSWPGPEGHRWRLAGFVRLDHIEGLITPEEAILWNLQNDLELSAARRALDPALTKLSPWPLSVGVFGSVAMEMTTGRKYTTKTSDLDLRLKAIGHVDGDCLQACLDILLELEKEFNIRIDAELTVNNGFGVSIKEVMSNSATVVGKGPVSVVLLNKRDVFAFLSQVN